MTHYDILHRAAPEHLAATLTTAITGVPIYGVPEDTAPDEIKEDYIQVLTWLLTETPPAKEPAPDPEPEEEEDSWHPELLSLAERLWAHEKWCRGYTIAEIAKALGCSIKTVERTFKRYDLKKERPPLVYPGREKEE